MNDYRIDIEPTILQYAEHTYKNLVPLQRKSGFSEIPNQFRGQEEVLS